MNEKRTSRGRPTKKPGYNRETEIQNLINTAVECAIEPFDDERDPDLPTLTEIAEAMETTYICPLRSFKKGTCCARCRYEGRETPEQNRSVWI